MVEAVCPDANASPVFKDVLLVVFYDRAKPESECRGLGDAGAIQHAQLCCPTHDCAALRSGFCNHRVRAGAGRLRPQLGSGADALDRVVADVEASGDVQVLARGHGPSVHGGLAVRNKRGRGVHQGKVDPIVVQHELVLNDPAGPEIEDSGLSCGDSWLEVFEVSVDNVNVDKDIYDLLFDDCNIYIDGILPFLKHCDPRLVVEQRRVVGSTPALKRQDAGLKRVQVGIEA